MEQLGCMDVWREQHPDKLEFTCYSKGHKVCSRLDRFLISEEIMENMRGSQHLVRYLSDHAPAEVTYDMGTSRNKSAMWRLRTETLIDPALDIRGGVGGSFCDQLEIHRK